jgi:hypothetical protein
MPESFRSTLDLLCDLWDQVGRFKSRCHGDEFILALLSDLEDGLVAMGVVLVTNIEIDVRSLR